MAEQTMLFWSNGFYYAYSKDENGKAQKQTEPIDAEGLEIIAETPLNVTLDFTGSNSNALVVLAYAKLEKEAVKYAKLKNHEGFVTLDDHRKVGDTVHIKPFQLFEYDVRGNVLLLSRTQSE
tara:strand:+ start:9048 stop:9413 length:366 start_codon:yes stop_codon:yes gene_type:complete